MGTTWHLHYKGRIWVRYKSVLGQKINCGRLVRLSIASTPNVFQIPCFSSMFHKEALTFCPRPLSIGQPSWHPHVPLSRAQFLFYICQVIQQPIFIYWPHQHCHRYFLRSSSPSKSSTATTSFSNLLPRTRKGAARMVSGTFLTGGGSVNTCFFRTPCIWSPFFILQREQHFITTAIQHKQFWLLYNLSRHTTVGWVL